MPNASTPLRHIAFIMDGNGRYATAKGLPRLEGHRRGVETLKKIIETCAERGIPHATFYAFSSENWGRPEQEVSGLFNLMRLYFKSEIKALMEKNVRVRFIGDRTGSSRLATDIRTLMNDMEQQTANNTGITATFAINYSGRDELTRAVQMLVEDAQAGTHDATKPVGPEDIAQRLDTYNIPDPDLVIRTSGEQRISNFMLWQMAYSEFYFTPKHWPEFTAEDLDAAIDTFTTRERRFGKIKTA